MDSVWDPICQLFSIELLSDRNFVMECRVCKQNVHGKIRQENVFRMVLIPSESRALEFSSKFALHFLSPKKDDIIKHNMGGQAVL